jgi:hypothetical protein
MKEKLLQNNSSGLINISSNILASLPKTSASDKTATKSKISVSGSQFQDYPIWLNERAFLSWDFYPNSEKFEQDVDSNKLSLSQQEDMIIDDILNCMSVRQILETILIVQFS